MNVIATRFRDIPFEEWRDCIDLQATPITERDVRAEWAKVRGKPVSVIASPLFDRPSNARCDGPFYRIVNRPHCLCHHIAEIGD